MFDIDMIYYSWSMLKADPYRQIFYSKMLYMYQNGIMIKLSGKKLFEATESEPLEPLKLDHFYLVLIGIAVGLISSSVSFGIEFTCKRKQMSTKKGWNIKIEIKLK